MAQNEPTQFRRFSDYRERLDGLWRGIDVRAGAIMLRGEAALLHVTVRLDHRPADEIEAPSVNPTVDGLYEALWEPRSIADLPAILSELEAGCLTVRGTTIRVAASEDDRLGLTWWAGLASQGPRDENYPFVCGNCAYLFACGHPLVNLCGSTFPTKLEHAWRSLERPFVDEADVLRTYFGLHVERRDQAAVLLHCLAPIPIELRSVAFPEDGPTVVVGAGPTAKADAIRLGWVADEKHRSSVPCSTAKPKVGADGWRSYEIRCPEPSAREAVVLLHYQGVHLAQLHVYNRRWRSSNPAVQVHDYFDPGRRALHKALYGDEGSTKPSQNFEAGVAWLLAFCGLPPVVYAHTAVHDEIDLVSYVPDERLVVCVECTVGGPSKDDKLNKLYKRSREVGEQLPDHDVLAVLATQWSDDHLTDEDRGSLREKGVVLLAREGLEKLERMAMTHAPVTEVLRYLRDCIPVEDPLKGVIAPNF